MRLTVPPPALGGEDAAANARWLLHRDVDGLERRRRERLVQRLVDALLDRRLRLALHLGDLAHEEELGSVEHALFAERKRLLAGQEGQALEDHGDLVEAPRPHLVRVLLEAGLPVRLLIDGAVAEKVEDLPGITRRNDVTEADSIRLLLGDPNARFVLKDSN